MLLAVAAQAQAELCGSVADQPEAVHDRLVDELMPFLPISDESLCEKITKTAVAACHSAVSDTASCLDSLAGSVPKAMKPACTLTKSPSFCNDDAKADAAAERAEIQDDADGAHALCDGLFRESFFDVCFEGFPM